MTSNFIRYDQDQQHLLPKNVAEWVEEESLERHVSDVIDHLDNEGRLDPFYPDDREDGRGVVCERVEHLERLPASMKNNRRGPLVRHLSGGELDQAIADAQKADET